MTFIFLTEGDPVILMSGFAKLRIRRSTIDKADASIVFSVLDGSDYYESPIAKCKMDDAEEIRDMILVRMMGQPDSEGRYPPVIRVDCRNLLPRRVRREMAERGEIDHD